MRWLAVVLAGCVAALAAAQEPARAPVVEKRPFVVKSAHGERRDEYHWLRDDDPRGKRPEVLRHLEAENRHTEAVLAPLRTLRERLYQEMVSRVKADDTTVPVYDGGGWWVWQQYEAGAEHPRVMRRRGPPEGPDLQSRPEVLLDLPQQAIAQRNYSLGRFQLSPDGQWLAWTEDVVGRGAYDLYIQNLRSRKLSPERIRGVLEGFAWAADSRHLFYVRQDPVTLVSGRVMRHARGSDPAADAVVHDEPDRTLFVEVRPSASRRLVLIDIHGTDTAELRAVPADAPTEPAAVVFARQPGVRLHAEHLGTRWIVRTNEGAPLYRLVAVPDKTPAQRDTWRDLLPARDDVTLDAFEVFEQGLAVEERVQARRRVRVFDSAGKELRVIDGGEASSASLGEHRDAGAAFVQVVLQSMIKPPATLEVSLATGRELLRRQDVVRGFDPALYRTQQLRVTTRDGAQVPVTLAWRTDRARRDGSAALLIEAYGAYGQSYEPEFGPQRLALMDRGFVVAIAHVRGGGELGPPWHDAARRQLKPRSFDDFVEVTEHLVAERWASPDKVFAQGASAGGMLLGAVANRSGGTRFRGMALDVPFLDVLTAMLDESLPLTVHEWGQWGDPRDKADYEALLAWSPYDNIVARSYPAMLVTTALWDSKVPVHDPVKYVARLRERKTDRQPVLLHVDMNTGHAGGGARYDRPRHWARQAAFFLDLAGLAQVAPEPAAGLATGDVLRSIKLTR